MWYISTYNDDHAHDGLDLQGTLHGRVLLNDLYMQKQYVFYIF